MEIQHYCSPFKDRYYVRHDRSDIGTSFGQIQLYVEKSEYTPIHPHNRNLSLYPQNLIISLRTQNLTVLLFLHPRARVNSL